MILCGGAGTRLWPLSRKHYPKQLLPLVDNRSLLQNTVLRLQGYREVAAPILVCNEEHRFIVAEQMRETGMEPGAIILEPAGRNTAPAVALGAHQIADEDDAIMVSLHSDNIIADNTAFLAALDQAIALAEKDYLVTFGVTPTHAETAYGYIRSGESLDAGYRVKAFVEKPDAATAEKYFTSGGFYWNSGMFVFKPGNYLAELARLRPEIASAVAEACRSVSEDNDFTRVGEDAFIGCPGESIDCAVMEGTHLAAMVPLNAGWSDIGSWDALWAVSAKDANRNTLVGDVMTENVNNSYIRAEHRLVSVLGLDDLVVVETADAILISTQKEVASVRNIVRDLNASERQESMTHRKVYRPWGFYENIDEGERYKVKHIQVNPGSSLSLQKHRYRAEHWVVVKGSAQVTRGEEVYQLSENESTYIPTSVTHRLENTSTAPLEIIEVQSGSYLSEDDIIRLEDNYGRK